MLNKYEKAAARCMKAAEQVDDAVLSFGFRNMAEAWLELGKKRSPDVVQASSRRQPSPCITKSGRVTGRSRGASPVKRDGRTSSKFAAKHRTRPH